MDETEQSSDTDVSGPTEASDDRPADNFSDIAVLGWVVGGALLVIWLLAGFLTVDDLEDRIGDAGFSDYVIHMADTAGALGIMGAVLVAAGMVTSQIARIDRFNQAERRRS